MRFPGFLGNQGTKDLLSACVDGGRFPHALLIEGPPGSGRRTLARLLAAAAMCESEGERPCGVCPACHKALSGIHPDIEELGGDGSARSFHIDIVRDLKERALVLPNEAPRRVMILTGADGMTVQAQNALLKILEEPPASLLFLLTCENRAKLLPTVRSRTLCVTVQGVGDEEALPFLRRQVPTVPEERLREALTLYDGCIGRVLAAVGGEELTRVRQLAKDIAAALPAPREWALMQAVAPLDQKDKGLTDDVLAALRLLIRDALAGKSVSPPAAELSKKLPAHRLAALFDAVGELQEARRRNINQTLLLTLMCARLRVAAGKE